jgi:diketogulonate reductase-like aldo/keto reductase
MRNSEAYLMLLTSTVRNTALPSGEAVPVLGQGTWGLAEQLHPHNQEVAALQLGIDLGMTLIDTAELYGSGATERLVGEAITGRRDSVFLVSKVLPHHADKAGTVAACEKSLQRLRTDRLDLYLLHWRGRVPLQSTIDGFEELMQAHKIRYWGVSNFGMADMQDLDRVIGGASVAINQVLYNLTRRGIEFDLLPWCREREIPIMAYSPIEQGRMLSHPVLQQIASKHDATPAQVGLAWVLRQDRVIAIPRAGSAAHVQENRTALDITLAAEDFALLDRAFPAPRKHVPLEML